MKNLEKYIDKILDSDLETIHCTVCKLRLGYDPCEQDENLTKKECDAECIKNRKWLKEEYIEPIYLSHDEYVILKNILSFYKYIYRDASDTICICNKEACLSGNRNVRLICFNHLFDFVKYEDGTPYSIQELVENYEKEHIKEDNYDRT